MKKKRRVIYAEDITCMDLFWCGRLKSSTDTSARTINFHEESLLLTLRPSYLQIVTYGALPPLWMSHYCLAYEM
jgi:hypothetical protein